MLLAQKGEPSFAKGIWQRVAAWLHSKKEYKPEMLTEPQPRELLKETFRVLNQPLQSLSVSQQIPPEISSALSRNTFIFSGFKTHCQLKEASLLLKDSDGNFKPFNRFLNDVQNIDTTYNQQYLHAEYNHAVASTQMAVKWNDWQQDGDRYDLQYRTAEDAFVRESHRLLDKTTLPISDPFWQKYLPPNGWNCRCTAVQVRKGKYPLSDPALAMQRGDNSTSLPKQQIFRFNPGKSLQVFPPKHPYFPKGCGTCNKNAHLSYNPQSDNCKACASILRCLKEEERDKSDKKYKNGWSEVKRFPNGGYIMQQDGHGDFEAKQNIKSATPLAEAGMKVELIKQQTHRVDGIKKKISTRDANVYGSAKLDCSKWEFKYTEKYNDLSKSMGTKAGQAVAQGADVVLIDIYKTEKFSTQGVLDGVFNAFNYNRELKGICLMIESNKFLEISRVYFNTGHYVDDIKKWLNR